MMPTKDRGLFLALSDIKHWTLIYADWLRKKLLAIGY